MTDDTRVLTADGGVHLVPPQGRLTFCGREPVSTLLTEEPAPGPVHPECVELAAARDHAQTRPRAL